MGAHGEFDIQAKEMRVYAITAASGAKLKPAPFTDQTCPDDGTCHALTGGHGRGVHGKGVSIADVAAHLENWTDCPAVDHTRLTGLFTIDTEQWANLAAPSDPARDRDRTGIPTVLAPLGRSLKPAKVRSRDLSSNRSPGHRQIRTRPSQIPTHLPVAD